MLGPIQAKQHLFGTCPLCASFEKYWGVVLLSAFWCFSIHIGVIVKYLLKYRQAHFKKLGNTSV